MKLAMSSWSFEKAISCGRMDQMRWLELCAEYGMDGAELLDIHFPENSARYRAGLLKRCEELGLETACLSISNDFGIPLKRLRKASEKKALEWIGLAAEMNAPVVRVFAGWPSPGNVLLYNKERKRLWKEMIRRLGRLCEEASEAGIVLGLENHNHHGFTRTVEDMLAILEEVGSNSLKVTLDTGDYLVDTPDINGYRALELAAPFAAHVHAKFYEVDEQGKDSRQDYGKILALLNDAGYNGFVSIEYEGPDDEDAVRRAAGYLFSEMRKQGLR